MHLTLYRCYVENTKMLAERLREAFKAGATMSAERKGLKRRFAWEFDGTRLHEHYLENLTAQPTSLAPRHRCVGRSKRTSADMTYGSGDSKKPA
jgi:hypothetical protein